MRQSVPSALSVPRNLPSQNDDKKLDASVTVEMAVFHSNGKCGCCLEQVYLYLMTVLPTSVEAKRAFSAAGVLCTKTCLTSYPKEHLATRKYCLLHPALGSRQHSSGLQSGKKMAELEEEVGVLVQRVVKDINSAFKKNPNIDEIGLIPCPEARYNRSPIVLVENKLGVESWCIKFLLPYVHNKLLLFRQRKQWFDRDALIDITCTLLLLNPDFTTAWNVRKELIQFGALSPEKDLYLGKLALTKFPKSPETWIHRRWVLKRLLQEHCPHSSLAKDQNRDVTTAQSAKYQEILHDELKVCTDAAGRYPSNYNAWSHRIWVLQNMAEEDSKIIYDELCSSKYWVSMHISDHSGFHYRQFLLKSLIRRSNFILDKTVSAPSLPTDHCASLPKEESSSEIQTWSLQGLFDEELDLCNDLIESYPGHEALWCHR
ncbi:PTAR1 protein, partial [Polypterus senegalus]